MSTRFSTLRDMGDVNIIPPSQLRTVKRLGKRMWAWSMLARHPHSPCLLCACCYPLAAWRTPKSVCMQAATQRRNLDSPSISPYSLSTRRVHLPQQP